MTTDRKIDDDHVGIKYDEVVVSKEELAGQKVSEKARLNSLRQQVTLCEAELVKINMRISLLEP